MRQGDFSSVSRLEWFSVPLAGLGHGSVIV